MELGERHEIEGVMHECVSVGKLDEEGLYDVEDGRVPLPGEEGILIAPDSDPNRGYWMQPVSMVEQRARVSMLEMEMDALMPEVRRELLKYEESGEVPLHVAASLARAAAAFGYEYGAREQPQGALAERAGYEIERGA